MFSPRKGGEGRYVRGFFSREFTCFRRGTRSEDLMGDREIARWEIKTDREAGWFPLGCAGGRLSELGLWRGKVDGYGMVWCGLWRRRMAGWLVGWGTGRLFCVGNIKCRGDLSR